MKQIYVITPLYPFPPIYANQKDIVGRIGLFQELGYEVTVFPFPLPQQKFDIIADEGKYNVKIELLERKKEPFFKEYRLHKLWYKASLLMNQTSFNKLSRFVKQNKPDVLWFEYSALSPLAHAISKTYEGRIIFRAHNYELKHYLEKHYINLKNNIKSALTLSYPVGVILNIIGISKCEKLMFKTAKKVACISTKDMSYFKQCHNYNHNYKNIVHLPYFPPEEVVKHKTNMNKNRIDVFYFGSDLKNNVNKSGLDFIVKKIIPILRKKDVDFITFHILGKNPPGEYKSSDIPYLKIHGFVDDLNKFLENMDVAIVPVFYGMGFKVKIYEALKRGFPVVASKRALSTINGIDGEDYFIAQRPAEFVEKLNLLRDANLRKKMGDNASKLIARDFSKENVLHQLEKVLSIRSKKDYIKGESK